MNKTYNKLKKIKEVIQKKIDDRECYYKERTGKWKSSEKADEYESRTEVLNSAKNSLYEVMSDLEEFLNRG